MKNFISLFIACAALVLISSCSGSHKACAAYAKLDAADDTTPQAAASFEDLQ